VAVENTKQSIQIIFVLGLPGAGKGTLCKRLCAEVGWHHISAGDHLRELCSTTPPKTDATFGGMTVSELQTNLKERKLAPPAVVRKLMDWTLAFGLRHSLTLSLFTFRWWQSWQTRSRRSAQVATGGY